MSPRKSSVEAWVERRDFRIGFTAWPATEVPWARRNAAHNLKVLTWQLAANKLFSARVQSQCCKGTSAECVLTQEGGIDRSHRARLKPTTERCLFPVGFQEISTVIENLYQSAYLIVTFLGG